MPTSSPSFSLTRSDHGAVVVAPPGELDASRSRQLQRALADLLDAGEFDVVVDLTETPVVSAAAVGVLLGVAKDLRERGGNLHVTLPASASLSLLPPHSGEDADPGTPVPLPADEAGRLAALRHLRLGREREDVFDDLVRLTSKVCGTPMAALTLVDTEHEWCKAAVGVDPWETPRHGALGAWVVVQDGVFTVADAAGDRRFAHSPLVTGCPRIRFYAAVPVTAGTHAVATLCVMDTEPHVLTAEEAHDLAALGRQATAQLELRSRRADVEPGERGAAEERLLRTKEVAQLFAVSERTVNYWASQGRLRSRTTAGGHRRYAEEDVLALLRQAAEDGSGADDLGQ